MTKAIAVDLDGVIHAYSKGWHDGSMYDGPIEGSHQSLEKFVDQGFKVVILTARINPEYKDANKRRENVEEWLLSNEFIKGEHYHELTNNKPAASVYIDDRGLRFNNWDQTISDLKDILPK